MNSMLLALAKNDFKSKYAGSVFGVVWAFVQPVVTIFIYWFVFGIAFQSGAVDGAPFVLWLVAGVVPWLFFSEGVGSITSVLPDYSYLVKKMVFPVGQLPYIRMMSALFVHLFFVGLIFVIAAIYGHYPRILHFQILYYIAAGAALTFGAGRIFAVFTAFFKDMKNIVGVIIQIGFWLTPIFWEISALPENLRFLFSLNPVYYIVRGYRDTFVYGIAIWQDFWGTVYFWGVAAVLLVLGAFLFERLRPHFADVL